MRWGDVKLCKTDQGVEYLEFNERQTKQELRRITVRCETLRTKECFQLMVAIIIR